MLTGAALEVYLRTRGIHSLSFVSTPDAQSGAGSVYYTNRADTAELRAALIDHPDLATVGQDILREAGPMWRVTFTTRVAEANGRQGGRA